MIFNGYDFNQYWHCRVDERPAFASRSISEKSIPGRAGSLFARIDTEPLDIDVSMRLRLPQGQTDHFTVNHIKRQSYAALLTGKPQFLILDEEQDKRYKAVVYDSTGFDSPAYVGACTVAFHLVDPIAESIIKRTYPVGAIDNMGTRPCAPHVECTANAGRSVRLSCGDAYIDAVDTFLGGETVAFDIENARVFKDGIPCTLDIESTFFDLQPGLNSISLQGATHGVVTYRERWA